MVQIRPPRHASLCTVFIEKVVHTPSGDTSPGWGTGFLYREDHGKIWLVTNWHVLTGRRPDYPGELLSGYPQSPFRIKATFAMEQKGAFSVPIEIDLYQDGNPTWIEHKRELGIDLAAIQIKLPLGAAGITIQDFASQNQSAIEPGMDVILTGYPMAHTKDDPFPIWKRAMISSEPGFVVRGAPQILIDTPGIPGMSGSPVYRTSQSFLVDQSLADAFEANEQGELSSSELINSISENSFDDETVSLELVGVYAGAAGGELLNDLKLGRMFMANFVDMMIADDQPGVNPFPPGGHDLP